MEKVLRREVCGLFGRGSPIKVKMFKAVETSREARGFQTVGSCSGDPHLGKEAHCTENLVHKATNIHRDLDVCEKKEGVVTSKLQPLN